MAVDEVTEVPVNRQGEEMVEFATGGLMQTERKFHRQFIVTVTDRNDGPEVVLKSRKLPKLMSGYKSGNDRKTSAVCTRRTAAQRKEGQLIFDVRCDYTTQGGEKDNPDNELRQVVRWSLEQTPKLVLKDINGNEVRNAARDPFDPPPEIDEPIVVANITRREKAEEFDLDTLIDLSGTICSRDFQIDEQRIRKGWALFAGYDSSDIIKDGERYKEVTYVIKIWPFNQREDNPDAHANFSKWDGEYLEHGPNYINAAGVKVPCTVGGYRYNCNLHRITGAALGDLEKAQYSFFNIRKRRDFNKLKFK